MERRGPRFQTELKVLFSSSKEEARSGVLVVLSRYGGRVRTQALRPRPDTYIGLSIFTPFGEPIEVEANVAHHLDDGFSVEFWGTPIELLQLIDMLSTGR